MGVVQADLIDRRRRRATRSPPVYDTDAFSRHVGQVGEIMYLWNRVQDNLFMIFWSMIGADNHAKAYEIWHTIQSDSNQRGMVERLAAVELNRRLCGHVQWVCRAHDKLAPYRNAFAHLGFYYDVIDGAYVPIGASARRQALERLNVEPKDALFKKLRGDLAAVENYSEMLGVRLFYGIEKAASPWPERPRLRLVPTGRPRQPKADRQSRKAKPTPPLE